MNAQNAHQYIPLVQALADGKTIQGRHSKNHDWIDKPYLNFLAEPECYRIKPDPPKPREWWGNVYSSDSVVLHISQKQADDFATRRRIACIKLREVLPETP